LKQDKQLENITDTIISKYAIKLARDHAILECLDLHVACSSRVGISREVGLGLYDKAYQHFVHRGAMLLNSAA
jgi:hypothetical protein